MNVLNSHVSHLSDWDVCRGLLWYEWHKQKWVHYSFCFLFFCIIAFDLVLEPSFLTLFGLIYAITAGWEAGSGKNEELLFSLPPLRIQQFLIRFIVGIVPLLTVLFLWALIIKSHIPGLILNLLLSWMLFTFQFITHVLECEDQARKFSPVSMITSVYFLIVIGVFLDSQFPAHRLLLSFFFLLGGLFALQDGYRVYKNKEISIPKGDFLLSLKIIIKPIAIITAFYLLDRLYNFLAFYWTQITNSQISRLPETLFILFFPFVVIAGALAVYYLQSRDG